MTPEPIYCIQCADWYASREEFDEHMANQSEVIEAREERAYEALERSWEANR